MNANYAFNPIAEQDLRSNQTIVPQRVNAALAAVRRTHSQPNSFEVICVGWLRCMRVVDCLDLSECIATRDSLAVAPSAFLRSCVLVKPWGHSCSSFDALWQRGRGVTSPCLFLPSFSGKVAALTSANQSSKRTDGSKFDMVPTTAAAGRLTQALGEMKDDGPAELEPEGFVSRPWKGR